MTTRLLDVGAYRWAPARVVAHLARADGVALVLAALESRNPVFAPLVHWLMEGDAPLPRLSTRDCLNDAVICGCWHAAESLSLMYQRSVSYPINWAFQGPGIPLADSVLRRVMIAASLGDYTFPNDVIAAIAARGELEAVQCMLAKGGNNRTAVDAFQAAANARQLRVVAWLASHTPELQHVLVDVDDLEAIACVRVSDLRYHRPHGVRYMCATVKYGYGEHYADDDAHEMTALVGQFSRHGDVAMLQALYNRSQDKQWDVAHAVECAVGGGYVDVIHWLERTFPDQRSDPSFSSSDLAMSAVASGHVDFLQWFRQRAREGVWQPLVSGLFLEAVRSSQMDCVRFFCSECGYRPAHGRAVDLAQPCTAIESMGYLLSLFPAGHFDGARVIEAAAASSSRAVVEYLVLSRGFWSSSAFRASVAGTQKNSEPFAHLVERRENVEVCRFLYAQAHARAAALNQPFQSQVKVDGIAILSVAYVGNYATAQWLAESVPEVDTGETVTHLPSFHERHFPTTRGAQGIILACLRARPAQCRGVVWLPQWSVLANCYDAFAMLVDMEHPSIDDSTATLITRELRDVRFMVKILGTKCMDRWSSALVANVIEWAAGIGAMQVLQVPESRWHAAWEASTAKVAAQSGHLDVLQWLLRRGRLSDATALTLVPLALQFNHVDCLQWLLTTFPVPPEELSISVFHAAYQRDDDMIRMLTEHIGDSFPLSFGLPT